MSEKKKILLFDDNKEVLAKVYIELLLKNFQVEVTSDPSEIVARALRFKPDIVVVNNDVKDFNGFEVCTFIRKKLRKRIVLLVDPVTSSTDYVDSCKADAIVDKPVNISHLSNVLYVLLNG